MKNSFLIIGIVITLFACKKSSTTTTPVTTNNNNNSSSGYYGIFPIYQQQVVNGGTIGLPNSPFAIAFFLTTPATTLTTNYTKVNSVSLNGVGYKFYSYQYQDSTFSTVTAPFVWAVNGMGAIPSFTYTNNNPMPNYAGYNSLPDTVFKTQQNIIPITGITGADTTIVTIEDFASHKISIGLAAGATSVTFSASALSTINIGNNASFIIDCQKRSVQTFGGKSFSFPITYHVTKTISVK